MEEPNMVYNLLLFSSLLVFWIVSFIHPISSTSSSSSSSSSSSCPIDLSYVKTVPWDTSRCSTSQKRGECCQALLSLYGMGIAQYLKDTSMFQLPNKDASASCLSDLQEKVSTLSVDPSVVPFCFKDANAFVGNASKCAGIFTKQDWSEKAGRVTQLDVACKGDLSDLTRCSLCREAGFKINSRLKSLDPNASSNCFDFVCLYATAFASNSGPVDVKTAVCTMRLPLAQALTQKPDSGRKDRLLPVVFASSGGVIGVLLALLSLAALYRRWDRKRKQNASDEAYRNSFRATVLPNSGAKWFDLSELERATKGFSQKNFIGRGGYGVVYKGTLEDGSLIAVKEMQDLDSQGDEEFSNEVEIISKIRHRNLLSLRGCCVSRDDLNGKRRYLVYDYMCNGSLGDYLYNDHKRNLLTWLQRRSIILDVANGLTYLHNGVKPAIYHRDIKANNILLDMDMKAKVADFGLAKQSLDGQSHVTTRVAGTHGYLAPEYALYGQLTEKSDVYSFGIVILEIMSGRKALDVSDSSSFVLITDWAWQLAKAGEVDEIFDQSIKQQGPKGIMERFVLVGLLCAHVMVAFRPTVADALKMLEGDIDIPPLPDRPLPLSQQPLKPLWDSRFFSTSLTSGWSSSTSGMN